MVIGQKHDILVAKIVARSHEIISGLDQKLGGHDEGPNPHELLEASLAACTILTVELYALRKGIKLKAIDVNVKILSEGAHTQIAREVSFRGDLTDEQRNRLVEIAGKCPIHRLLESDVKIETSLAQR